MELKFRAWHKERESYLKVSAIYFGMQAIYVNERSYQGYCYFDEIIIEQYTGLKDKNGNEIYVGDIVKGEIGFYKNFCGMITADLHLYNEGKYLVPLINFKELEKVGNIHENKELLKWN